MIYSCLFYFNYKLINFMKFSITIFRKNKFTYNKLFNLKNIKYSNLYINLIIINKYFTLYYLS